MKKAKLKKANEGESYVARLILAISLKQCINAQPLTESAEWKDHSKDIHDRIPSRGSINISLHPTPCLT